MFGALIYDAVFVRLPRLAIFGLCLSMFSVGVAAAQYCTPDQCDECDLCRCSQRCCHELPELWLINTRCAPRCRNLDRGFDCLIYKRYDRQCCRWVRESRESFLAQESMKPTLFYSHGNSLNHKNAMKSCWQIYCKMRCCQGPKRLVFWSWPAERVYKTEGLRVREMIKKNLRIKYVYAEYQGYYMAKLVNQMSLSQRVMMSGHSYGAITAAAAMHLIGGGCLRGLTLEGGAAVEHPNLRAAMISGAFDHDMLNPGNRYGQTFVAAEKVFVTRNIKDRTLKKWPKTSWRCKRAIGVLGVNANCLGVYRNKLCQQTLTSDVGTSHYLKPHLKSTRFVAALCCLSFPQCNTCHESEPALPAEPDLMTDQQLEAEAELVLNDEALDVQLTSFSAEAEEALLWDTTQLMDREFYDQFSPEVTLAESVYPEDLSQQEFQTITPELDFKQTEALLSTYERNASVELVDPPVAQLQPTAAASQVVVAATSTPLWYSGGLCLAFVLTGQVYILLSKRMSAS